MAVVVLASKVFLEPDKTVELGRQTVAPTAAKAPRAQTIAEAPEPDAPAPTATAAPAEKTLAKETADREESSKREVHKHAAASHAAAKAASAAAPKPASAAPADSIDRLLGASQGAGKGGRGSGSRRRDISDDALDGLMGEDARSDKAFRPAPAAKPARPAKRDEFAPPPPPRAQPAPAPAAPAKASRAMEEEDNAMEASPPPRVGGAGVPGGASGAPPAAHASPRMKKKAAEGDMEESAAADEEEAPPRAAQAEKRKAPAKNDKPAAEAPIAQADRLFAAGRWAEAARAYRELLRSDPRNADAGRWKQRLAAAEAEMAPPARAASKAAPP